MGALASCVEAICGETRSVPSSALKHKAEDAISVPLASMARTLTPAAESSGAIDAETPTPSPAEDGNKAIQSFSSEESSSSRDADVVEPRQENSPLVARALPAVPLGRSEPLASQIRPEDEQQVTPEPVLHVEEEAWTRLIFDYFDKDHGGSISIHEFTAVVVRRPHVASFISRSGTGLNGNRQDAAGRCRFRADAVFAEMGGGANEVDWPMFRSYVAKCSAASCPDNFGADGTVSTGMASADLPLHEKVALIFEMCDADGSGTISLTELTAFFEKHPEAVQVFASFRDFSLEGEQQGSTLDAEDIFAELDEDGSREVTLEELQTFIETRSTVPAAWVARHASGSSSSPLTEEEAWARLIFAFLDKDGSGSISMHEFVAFAVKHPHIASFVHSGIVEPESYQTKHNGRRRSSAGEGCFRDVSAGATQCSWENFRDHIAKSATASSAALPLQKRVAMIFEMCDLDGSGTISLSELSTFCEEHPEASQVLATSLSIGKHLDVEALFSELDEDDSRELSLEEVQNFFALRSATVGA